MGRAGEGVLFRHMPAAVTVPGKASSTRTSGATSVCHSHSINARRSSAAIRHNGSSILAAVTVLGLLSSLPFCAGQGNHLCFELLSDIPAIYLQEHPAGKKLTVATQDGLIRLTSLPETGSLKRLQVLSTFLDLTKRVRFHGEQGLLSFAFHPDFLDNGRFFVSYICDASEHADCQGPCAISAIHDPNQGPALCPWNTVVAEYSAGKNPSGAEALKAEEVRKILLFGRPYDNHNGGHIWFGSDRHLYYTSGDGGSQRDPLRTAQNGLVPLGKILRLDVDGTPGEYKWGTYAIPKDNPFVADAAVLPEVYALGFRNPWRCFEDPVTNVTFCGDVGQDTVEEIDVLHKGGNYGWSYFEGTSEGPHPKPIPPATPIGGELTGPVLQYCHPEVEDGVAVIGGVVYRSDTNPCLKGTYIYADEFGPLYFGTVFKKNSSKLLAAGSAIQAVYSIASPQNASAASKIADNTDAGLAFAENHLFSWATDASNEVYRLSTIGIHRVVGSSLCGVSCDTIEQVPFAPPPPPGENATTNGVPPCPCSSGAVHCRPAGPIAFILGVMTLLAFI